MKKITKAQLNSIHVFNGYDISKLLDNPFFIAYGSNSIGTTAWYVVDYRKPSQRCIIKCFVVFGRADKPVKLKQAIEYTKTNFGVEITDKDPFGNWHPRGTLERIIRIYETTIQNQRT